jgi:hypothetical protein
MTVNRKRLLLVDADCEPTTTLAAAIVQYTTTVGGLHPGAKAVRAEATFAMWLVGTLHAESPPERQKTGAGPNHAGRRLSRKAGPAEQPDSCPEPPLWVQHPLVRKAEVALTAQHDVVEHTDPEQLPGPG